MHEVDLIIEARLRKEGRRLVTRAEVLAWGGTDGLIRARKRERRWFEVQVGVYLIGLGPLAPAEERLAALLAVPQPAALSGPCGFVTWGLDGLAWAPVELTVPHTTHASVRGARVRRSRHLEGFVRKGLLVVTSVERTLLESGTTLPSLVIEKGLASGWRKGLTTPTKCLEYVEAFGSPWRRGSTKLAAIASRYDDGGRPPGSDGEVFVLDRLRPALADAGIEEPVRQFELALPDGASATIDLAWPLRRKGIEPGGLKGHGTVRDQAYDYRRRALAREVGWELEPVAPSSFDEKPRETTAMLIRFLRAPSLPDPGGRRVA